MPPIGHVRESRDSRAHTRSHARTQRSRKDITAGRVRPRRIPSILRGIPATRPNVGVVSDDRRDKLSTWSDRSHRHSWPDAPPDKFIKSLAEWIFVSRETTTGCHYKIHLFFNLGKEDGREKWERERKKIKERGKQKISSTKADEYVRDLICVNNNMFLQWQANRSVSADDRHCVDEWKFARYLIRQTSTAYIPVKVYPTNFPVKHD